MININLSAQSVSESFNLSDEKRISLNDKIFDAVKEWKDDPNDSLTTGDLLNMMMAVAETDEDQLYIAYQYGRITQLGFANLLTAELTKEDVNL